MWREKLREIHAVAESFGLVVRETEFHVLPAEQLYAVVATGLPVMYHHWSFGRDYERERTRHDQGRAITYELVCNLEPAQAFLLDQNSDAEHVFVCAHVMGHVDLFGRNVFNLQQRLDIDRVLQAARLRFAEYEREHGEAAVEAVIDAAHMLRWHSTPVELAAPRREFDDPPDPYRALFPGEGRDPDAARRRYREDRERYRRGVGERDLLRFLIRHAPLEEWQQDVLGVVREVALYFLPQTRVKVLHEGWASFWHRRILREIRAYPESDVLDARLHANIAGSPGRRLNPYWLGLTILEHLHAQGVDLLQLVRTESDRSLLGWIDEALVRESEALSQAAAELAKTEDPLGRKPWERLRDALVASLPTLPEVEVWVRDWDAHRLVLEAAVPVDEPYAVQVLQAVASLWQGEALLVAPGQELEVTASGPRTPRRGADAPGATGRRVR